MKGLVVLALAIYGLVELHRSDELQHCYISGFMSACRTLSQSVAAPRCFAYSTILCLSDAASQKFQTCCISYALSG